MVVRFLQPSKKLLRLVVPDTSSPLKLMVVNWLQPEKMRQKVSETLTVFSIFALLM